MAKKNKTSVGDAARVSLAALIFGTTAMIVIWIVGAAAVVAYRRGSPHDGDLWLVFWVSLVPWGIVLLQLIHSTTQGIDRAFPAPRSLAGELDHTLDGVPLWLADQPKVNGVYAVDLKFFVERICQTRDWTQRTWEGVVMPSNVVCDKKYLRKMISVLTNKGFIIGYKPRSSGRLLSFDSQQILNHLQIPQLLRSYQKEY